LNSGNNYIYAITATYTDIIADNNNVVTRQDNHHIDSTHDYNNALCIAIDYYGFNLNYDNKLSYDYDFNSRLMSTKRDSLSTTVPSLEPRSFDRFFLNLVGVDPHNTIFFITSYITEDLQFGILRIFIGIYDSLINTRRFAIIGNYGSSSIGIINKTIIAFIISYSSSTIEDCYDYDDYFVLIEHQFYDYSIRRWYISSLISLNGSNDYIYAITATFTDIIADNSYVVTRQDNHYIDSIHDYNNALCIAIDYYGFNLNYDNELQFHARKIEKGLSSSLRDE
jgi:hypothetical protein